MSDTAIFIAASAEDLKAANGLPGDLKTLRSIPDERERVVHTEILLDSPAPERFQQGLSQAGVWITVLPQNGDAGSVLITGLMERLHEFVCTYPSVGQFVLAGHRPERLAPAAAFLQRAGYSVVLCGPDRNKLEFCRHNADDVEVWGSGGGRAPRGGSESKAASDPDPFEVLVEEITKSRKRGHRVLLTSLKQRMRKRIRRFDETRLKDKDGKPMRKFKDFVVDAANRGLIQLIEKGNASHVLLPDEAADADEDADEDDRDDIESGDSDNDGDNGDGDGEGVDPLLDSVDTVGDDEDDNGDDEDVDDDGEEEEEPEAEEPLSPDAIDVTEIDEEADPPPKEFMEVLEEVLQSPLTLHDLVKALVKKQTDGVLSVRTRVLRDYLQSAFNNELIETSGDEKPAHYVLVDDWKDIIDYL